MSKEKTYQWFFAITLSNKFIELLDFGSIDSRSRLEWMF